MDGPSQAFDNNYPHHSYHTTTTAYPQETIPAPYSSWTSLKEEDLLAMDHHDEPVPTGGTSDFVKKLYNMLTDRLYDNAVAWSPRGDCFVVKDPHEFTKSILPRLFKHANFASFVRQLNKYDFHKVKNTEEEYGEQAWVFRHPDFHANQRHALENIKRKVPAARKQTTPPIERPPGATSAAAATLHNEVERLTQAQDELSAHIRNLERNYHDVLVEMVGFQRNMAQQDSLMQNLIQYFLQVENSREMSVPPPSIPRDWTSTINAAGGKFL